jgi:hypothetical protein
MNRAEDEYWTDPYLLAEVLRPLLEREGATLDADMFGKAAENGSGAVTVVCERAAMETGSTGNAIIRRLYDCLNDHSDAFSIQNAEALIVACGELMLAEPVPIFPSNPHSALDMAEAWAEDGDDIEALGNSLIRFALGWHAAESIVSPEEYAKRTEPRRRATERKRQKREAAKVS